MWLLSRESGLSSTERNGRGDGPASTRSYEKTLRFADNQGMESADPRKDKLQQNKMTEQLAEKMKAAGMGDLLIMSAGPYGRRSCMSAYCVNAQKMADAAGMICWNDDDKMRFFSQILFHDQETE